MFFEENVPNEQLRCARHSKGWTQSEIAERVGTDFETGSRWERRIMVPSAYFRERLCRVLEKTPQELGLIADRNEPLALPTSACVFLASSYVDAERAFVTDLKAHVQARGIPVLSTRTLRSQGVENQSKAWQEALLAAQAVLLIASPEARSSRHIQKALQLAGIYKRPICAVWIDGECWQECIPADCGEFLTIIDVRKNNDHRVFDEIIATLEEVWLASNETAVSITTSNTSAEPPLEPRNPYKGLKAFHREDRHDFFGRDGLVDELAGALNTFLLADEEHAHSARLLAVVGPSGSGKSSLVMAGLLPCLQSGGLPGSQEWVYLDPLLPGIDPIESLAISLARHLPHRSRKTLRDDLEDDSAGLHLLANSLGKPPERRVVLFIDQFEEVFTQTISEEKRQHFLDLLVTAVTERRGPTILILTLRADFYDRPMHYLELCKLIESHQRLVPPMDLKGLREVIEKPASLPDVQLTFEDDLVSDLLFDVQEQVGALPLLQFTLDQLFRQRSEHHITLKAYHEMGGVKGAMAKHAESTYAALPSGEHQHLVRVLFLRLIDPGWSEQDTTRRRAALWELSLPDAKQTTIMRETVDTFIAARLLTTNEVAATTTVEVSHEALIREWTRLSDWLREAREDIHQQQTISKDVMEWEQYNRPKERLYRGSQLTDAQGWARRNVPSEKEVRFLHASAAQRTLALARLLVLMLMLVSSTGIAGWFYLTQPPSPTLVTRLQDGVVGSLRWCITNAPSGSIISFAQGLKGTMTLTEGDLSFPGGKRLTIVGPGADLLTISGRDALFHVTHGATVNISGLSFKNSKTIIHAFLYNEGTLTVTNSLISDNEAIAVISSLSGGIENRGGILTVTDSTISNNSSSSSDAGGYGGGIDNLGIGTVMVTDSIFSGNSASGKQDGQGGGIYNEGTLTVTNSTFSGNSASSNGDSFGGGIANVGKLSVTNSTFANNSANGGNDSGGGGISSTSLTGSSPSSTLIRFCTVYANTSSAGGGIWVDPTGSNATTIRSSIVAANSADDGPDISGALISDGYNLVENVAEAKGLNASIDRQVTLAELKIDPTLRNNGGPTQTLALLPGSLAIDTVPGSACGITITDLSGHSETITTDQRGDPRPDGSEETCDSGAYESSS